MAEDKNYNESGALPVKESQIHPIFSEMDDVFKRMYGAMPNISYRQLYVQHLDNVMKAYGIVMFIGFLMIAVAFLYSVSL